MVIVLIYLLNGASKGILLTPYGNNDKFSEWTWNDPFGDELNVPFDFSVNVGKLINFSLVLNLLDTGNGMNLKKENYEGYKLSIYINGINTNNSYLNKEMWTDFIKRCKNDSNNVNTFFLGAQRCATAGKGAYTAYGKMFLKNCRFYTRALDKDEIKLNYDTTLAYDEINTDSN